MRKEGPQYKAARTAINRHLYHHHAEASGSGTLSERLEQHSELHALGKRFGVSPDHTHAISEIGETAEEEAFRVLGDCDTEESQRERVADG
jgi:hypothetical protein